MIMCIKNFTVQVQYRREGEDQVESKTVNYVEAQNSYSVDIEGLLSGYLYTVDVLATSNNVNSDVEEVDVATRKYQK